MSRSGQDKFVLKDIPKNILANFQQRILPCLREDASPLLRLPVDSFPDRNTLAYQFLTEDFLQLVRQNISMRNRWRILKACAQAIADLHDRDVVHLGMEVCHLVLATTNFARQISSLTTSWLIAKVKVTT